MIKNQVKGTSVNIYISPGILVKPEVSLSMCGFGFTSHIRIFEKLASQSQNLIMLFHRLM